MSSSTVANRNDSKVSIVTETLTRAPGRPGARHDATVQSMVHVSFSTVTRKRHIYIYIAPLLPNKPFTLHHSDRV